MHAHGPRLFVLSFALTAVVSAGCKKESPPPPQNEPAAAAPAPAPAAFSVTGVEVGKQVGPDKRITNPTTTFGTKDTIHASVTTDGAAPKKVIAARWTYQGGQVVKEAAETIAPTGPAATEFHISKPSGWPVGKYQVEISVDGTPSGSKDFEVKK
jgi:hypothetical protein